MACADIQIFNILEAVSKIAEKRVIQMFQHPALPNDIPNTLGADDCDLSAGGPVLKRLPHRHTTDMGDLGTRGTDLHPFECI